MDTLNRQKVPQSGVHVCHKCEWPFPNPHPSARYRRAHKKLCGTIEGYKLDTSQDKTPVDDSDDDYRITSDKFVERNLSRKSSSGVGRSSRSTRSEDEVFADAVTDFGEGSDSLSRGNSMQYTAEDGPDVSELDMENAIDDDSSASSVVLEDKQLLTAKIFEGKNDTVKDEIPSQDQSSINIPPLICASVTRENGNAVEHHLAQSSEGLDTNDEKCIGNDNLLQPKTPNIEITHASEHISGLNDKDDNDEGSDSPGNYNRSLNSIREVDTPDGNPSKSLDVAEEHEPIIEANENADNLVISNVVPLQMKAVVEQEIVGGLDQISDHNAPYDGGLQSEGLEEIRDGVWEDQEVSHSENQRSVVSSEKAFPEFLTTSSIHDEETCANVCGNAIDDVEVDGESFDIHHGNNSSKVPVEELYVTGSTQAECSADDITPQDEKLLLNVIDSSEVQVSESAATSPTLAEYHVYDIAPRHEPLMNNAEILRVNEITGSISEEQKSIVLLHDQGITAYGEAKAIDDVNDDDEYVVIHEADSNGVNDISIRPEVENEPVSAETIQPDEANDESVKSASSRDHRTICKGLSSDQGILTEAQNAGRTIASDEKSTGRVDSCDILKTDGCFDSSVKMSEFGGSLSPSSPTVSESFSEKFTEPASGVFESDSITNQCITISPATDIIHAGELTDIQATQSFSVPSAASVEPKAMEEVQHCEPISLSKPEFTCEIETSENQKQTALKTLLGEAIAKSRAESPNYEEIPAINPKTKEWDSPARYPVKIKTEKKRSKSRWVPFLCCSSSSSSLSANGP